jgi:indole-3-glycerol phosphate synthase
MSSVLDRIVATKWEEIAAAKRRCPQGELEAQLSQAPPVRDFLGALRGHSEMRLIAEVKKASPSKGLIRADFDPVSIARDYEAAGAAALSVLTDEQYFQGHLDYLRAIRREVGIPVLRKEFVLDPYQVVEARVAGADAVLLIAECLPGETLRELYECIVGLGMTALIELYEPAHLERVLATGTRLVGVNNRDLHTFEVDLGHVIRLRERIPAGVTVVAESGIGRHEDVVRLRGEGIEAMLVGESLMRQSDVRAAVRRLLTGESTG